MEEYFIKQFIENTYACIKNRGMHKAAKDVQNGSVKEIMPVEEWSNITKEDINRGIVVIDNKVTYDGGQPTGTVSDFNEYVWIPIPDISKFTRVAWTTPYGYDENGSWGSGGITHLLSDVSTLNRWWEGKTTQEYKKIW